MSDESSQAEAQPTAKKSPLAMIALVLGLAVGGGAGFAGIRLAAGAAPAAAGTAHAEKAAEHEAPDKDPVPLYEIENLVVNPYASQGTRFLMATLALEPSSAEDVEVLKKQDSQLRDAFLRVLGAKTVEQLSDITQRDSLKAELLREAQRVTGKSVRRIYFPQFVLQ